MLYMGEVYEREEHEHLVRGSHGQDGEAESVGECAQLTSSSGAGPEAEDTCTCRSCLCFHIHNCLLNACNPQYVHCTCPVMLPLAGAHLQCDVCHHACLTLAALLFSLQVRTVEEQDTEYTMDMCLRPDINWDGSDKMPEEAAE